MRTRGRALKVEPDAEAAVEEAKSATAKVSTPTWIVYHEASKSDETAPVATAVESAEAESNAASADEGIVNGGAAPDDGAIVEKAAPLEEEKPAPSEDVVKAPPSPTPAATAPAPAPASSPEAKENGSDESKPAEADASNGTPASTTVDGKVNGGAVEKEGGENGEITLGDNKDGQSKDDAAGAAADDEEKPKIDAAPSSPSPAAKEADMEVEPEPAPAPAPAPKEDVVVDYTDEFGRVRQMLQR
ncbi:unnamed protein product [Hapterophycus canaliculatus]